MSSKWGIRYEFDYSRIGAQFHEFDFGDVPDDDPTHHRHRGYLADVAPVISWGWQYQQGGGPLVFATSSAPFTFTVQYLAGYGERRERAERAFAYDVATGTPGRISLYYEGALMAMNDGFIVASAVEGYQWAAGAMRATYTVQTTGRPWYTPNYADLASTVQVKGTSPADVRVMFDMNGIQNPVADPQVIIKDAQRGWSNTYGLQGVTLQPRTQTVIDTRTHTIKSWVIDSSAVATGDVVITDMYEHRAGGAKGSGSYVFEKLPRGTVPPFVNNDYTEYSITGRTFGVAVRVTVLENYGPRSLVTW